VLARLAPLDATVLGRAVDDVVADAYPSLLAADGAAALPPER
jgi:hypothetical protein